MALKIPGLAIEKSNALKPRSPGSELPAKKKPRKRIRLPAFLNPSELLNPTPKAKFVLFIGDEGAILVYIKDNVVESRQFVPDNSADNMRELQDTLRKDTKAPLLLVVDSMDQSYVQQTLPPVSPLSVGKLIKRRLERDFANNEIKGAIVLGRDHAGRKDWHFMMVALEKSQQLSAWIDFVSDLPNRFQGIYLVSTESELIIKKLESAMGVPKEGTGSEWKFLVSHNKVGGVRQVILRNGRLIFTRMTQLVGEALPAVIAGNIEQEILSTIEYMRRLGFTSQAGLDIYIIGSVDLKPMIDPSKFNASLMHILTPYEVAQYLDIEGATQPTDQFGDVILAAVIGCNKKPILTLVPPQNWRLDMLYQAMIFQRAAATLITLAAVAYTCATLYDVYATYVKKADLEQMQTARERTLDSLRSEIKKSKLDVEKADDLIDLYQKLQQDKLTPLPFLETVGTVIKQPIIIKAINWSIDDAKTNSGHPKIIATFSLDFPGVDTLDAFKLISKRVISDLKTVLKGADVRFTQLPAKFSESQEMNISFDNNAPPANPQQPAVSSSSDAQLTIKGDVLTAVPPEIALLRPPLQPAPTQPAPLLPAQSP